MSDKSRCPVCIEHPGWAHPEDTGKRSDPADVCRACLGSGVELRQENSAPRYYTIGLPVSITVHPSGAVSFEVDLSEADDLFDDDDACDPDNDDEIAVVEADALIVSAAADRVKNHYIFTIPPTPSRRTS